MSGSTPSKEGRWGAACGSSIFGGPGHARAVVNWFEPKRNPISNGFVWRRATNLKRLDTTKPGIADEHPRTLCSKWCIRGGIKVLFEALEHLEHLLKLYASPCSNPECFVFHRAWYCLSTNTDISICMIMFRFHATKASRGLRDSSGLLPDPQQLTIQELDGHEHCCS